MYLSHKPYKLGFVELSIVLRGTQTISLLRFKDIFFLFLGSIVPSEIIRWKAKAIGVSFPRKNYNCAMLNGFTI